VRTRCWEEVVETWCPAMWYVQELGLVLLFQVDCAQCLYGNNNCLLLILLPCKHDKMGALMHYSQREQVCKWNRSKPNQGPFQAVWLSSLRHSSWTEVEDTFMSCTYIVADQTTMQANIFFNKIIAIELFFQHKCFCWEMWRQVDIRLQLSMNWRKRG
jgi:hypothetical protein